MLWLPIVNLINTINVVSTTAGLLGLTQFTTAPLAVNFQGSYQISTTLEGPGTTFPPYHSDKLSPT